MYVEKIHRNFVILFATSSQKYYIFLQCIFILGCLSLASEMNVGNIRLHMTLKINVGCLSLASEMNGGNIRLRMTLKINAGCLSLASEMNGGNIRLCMTLK